MTRPQRHDAEPVAMGRVRGHATGKMSVPIKAEVLWERREPAVDYTFANGDRKVHRIGREDWPILLQLVRARKLTFQNNGIRARFH
jgi:hypothetical protein